MTGKKTRTCLEGIFEVDIPLSGFKCSGLVASEDPDVG